MRWYLSRGCARVRYRGVDAFPGLRETVVSQWRVFHRTALVLCSLVVEVVAVVFTGGRLDAVPAWIYFMNKRKELE